MATRPKLGAVDNLLDEQMMSAVEIETALRRIREAHKGQIVMLAQLYRAGAEDIPQVKAMVLAASQINDALHVGRVALDQVRAAAHELRETPAIRRVRKQAWDAQTERRTKERREARQWDAFQVAI